MTTDDSTDFGKPAHILFEDLDSEQHRAAQAGLGSVWNIGDDAGDMQYRVKLLTLRGTTHVEDIWILRATDGSDEYETVLHLHGGAAHRLVGLMRNNAFDPADEHVRVESTPTALPDPYALAAAYEHDPAALRALIVSDARASDVVAVAHRVAVVAEFRKMLKDDAYFDTKVAAQAKKSKEGVWQEFFEANPWLLGLGLGNHLLVGWDPDRLEKVVAGYDVGGPGKRTDALMRTAGIVRLLAFGEIKHHRTDLLKKEYRPGCWAPSEELTGAVAQSQGTVQLAQEKLGTFLQAEDDGGFQILGEISYLYRPRSYVVAGQLSEFVSEAGGHNTDKIRSFELYRRNLYEPEILSFDEVLARAEALVASLGDEFPSSWPIRLISRWRR